MFSIPNVTQRYVIYPRMCLSVMFFIPVNVSALRCLSSKVPKRYVL